MKMKNNSEKSSPVPDKVGKQEAKEKMVQPAPQAEGETGGFEGRAEPTRYGDWEVDGRCSDF